MLIEITLPSFGSSVGEATLVEWRVSAGSEVVAGQVIAEIETDKAMAELEAPAGGVIHSIIVPAGSEYLAVGTVLAMLQSAGMETGVGTEGAAGEAGTAAMQTQGLPEAVRDDSTGTGPGSPEVQSEPTADLSGRIMASPYARKLAQEYHISLHGISGSGPGGRVVSRDLNDQAKLEAMTLSPSLQALGYAAGSYTLNPASKMRRAIAAGLSRSIREIPHYSLTADLDLDAVLAHRQSITESITASQQPGETRPSINDYLLWACSRALINMPQANSSWTDQGIALHRDANIALAVAIDGGLVTPVIHAAQNLSLTGIASTSSALIKRALQGQLKATDLQGATFTVSNLGMMGVRAFTSILSEPQACILSVGELEARAVVRQGSICVVQQATVTLTCDHRVVDGATGAAFLRQLAGQLAERLSSPASGA